MKQNPLTQDDLSKLGVAFFNMNGIISVAYLVVVLIAVTL